MQSITIRRANERGRADHGWLRSCHTFSFADYHDAAHMGFRSLRVINDDHVAPGMGFGSHPHRDMEIFSYVISGSLEHKDSLGNGRVLRPGEIQLMSAGTGVTHSENNPSTEEWLHFLQIWIRPEKSGLMPGYTEWRPVAESDGSPKVLVISHDGREGSATIHQDADIYRIRLRAGQSIQHEVRAGRGAWLQMAEGTLEINGNALTTGDGACTEEMGELAIVARSPVEALLFDLK